MNVDRLACWTATLSNEQRAGIATVALALGDARTPLEVAALQTALSRVVMPPLGEAVSTTALDRLPSALLAEVRMVVVAAETDPTMRALLAAEIADLEQSIARA